MEDIFGVAKISNIYLGCLIFLGVNSRCCARAYVRRKKECTSPLGFVHQFKPIKCIQVGFCPSGLLSQWAFVLVGFCPVGFCPSGLLS